MATNIFLYAANVLKVLEGGRGLPCIRLTVTRYLIDMNVSHRTPMFLRYSSQIVETETVSLEFSLKFLTFTLYTFVLTQKCPSPSPVLSHVYFGALIRPQGAHTICLYSRLLFYSKCTGFTVCFTYSDISLTMYIINQ